QVGPVMTGPLGRARSPKNKAPQKGRDLSPRSFAPAHAEGSSALLFPMGSAFLVARLSAVATYVAGAAAGTAQGAGLGRTRWRSRPDARRPRLRHRVQRPARAHR